jgi:prepilin-type N-terminal cleavage/methylation domain-containing protein
MNKKLNQKGFTLVELLVVISIIGLLSTMATVSVKSTKIKARDVRRASDIAQLRTALEMYNSEKNIYPNPNNGNPITLGKKSYSVFCAKENDNIGFYNNDTGCDLIFMARVPKDPLKTYSYTYKPTGDPLGQDYEIRFRLESGVESLNCTDHDCIATANGTFD